jgi:hypothetical protein
MRFTLGALTAWMLSSIRNRFHHLRKEQKASDVVHEKLDLEIEKLVMEIQAEMTPVTYNMLWASVPLKDVLDPDWMSKPRHNMTRADRIMWEVSK